MSNIITADANDDANQDARGFRIIHSLLSNSGFSVKLGVRDCGDIKIYEGVADGTGRTYLGKITVEIQGNVMIDENFDKVPYSRDFVRQFVGEKLFYYFKEAFRREGHHFSALAIRAKLDEILDKAYYEKSDKLILELVQKWGITTQKIGNERRLGS
jgi:hypothetical protein